MRRRRFLRELRLRPSVLTLYLLLTTPVFFAIVALTYVSNEQTARLSAEELIGRFRAEAIQNFQDRFAALRSLARSAAALGDERPDFYADNRSIGYLFSILLHSDKIVSAYVGLEDGSFRQARRMEPGVEVQGRPPPEGTRYAYRWIDVPTGGDGGGPRVDEYLFLDAERRVLGRSAAPTTYDPRVRLWYVSTRRAAGLHVTEPDVFAALGLVGFTVAAPFGAEGAPDGVAAIDLTLDGLSEYLAEHRISPGSQGFLLDHRGRVVANSERAATWANEGGRVGLHHVAMIGSPLASAAFHHCSRPTEDLCAFRHGGQDYVATLTTMPAQFAQPWQLLTVTPLRDFTVALRRNNARLLLVGLAALAVQVLIIYVLSAVISAPLERLAVSVRRIQSLDRREEAAAGGAPPPGPPLDSPIHEIAVLSRAVATLDAFVTSFAAYVPVGLVKQLMDSNRKQELGGSSRFLTVFFSDVEGFSTLSEEVPSRELMLRVSAYLQVVIRAVDGESGTIDKFIGDGVMAFWGAPALLDDHAWRACVAALRVQREMDALNARWAAQGLRPLNVRIGLHSDAVLVGNIGSPSRMSYTVLGDGVNIAARLEGVNKDYGTRICISHGVFKEAGERLCVRPIGEVAVRGRRARIPAYELLGARGAGPELEPSPEALRLGRMTRLAYEALVAGEDGLALARYREVLAEFPGDRLSREMVRGLEAAADGAAAAPSSPRAGDAAPRPAAEPPRDQVPRAVGRPETGLAPP